MKPSNMKKIAEKDTRQVNRNLLKMLNLITSRQTGSHEDFANKLQITPEELEYALRIFSLYNEPVAFSNEDNTYYFEEVKTTLQAGKAATA
jgi:hypothetical protein